VLPVGYDLETAEAGKLWDYGPGFLRLAGYTNDGDVKLTTDPAELLATLAAAPWLYGHNVLGFDLLALAHVYGADWESLAAKTLDTLILDRLDYPPEARDTAGSADRYDLSHVCERRGVPGKTDDLRELARKHGGYDKIPPDDPEYREYLIGDVRAIEALIDKLPRNGYAKREHRCQTIFGRMSLNGFRVDLPLLNERIEQGESLKGEALEILRDDYDLPLGHFEWHGRGEAKEELWSDFDNPLATLEGRKWLVEIWDAFGVRNPPVTDKGRLSTSAVDLRPLAESPLVHPDLRRILELMMTVTTTRTVYQTVADHLVGDRVHPLINMGQASGRSSVTSPGLTVFGKRGGRHVEREVFIPEPGYVVMSCDLSQVDMRAIAGLSQDPTYMQLFIGLGPDGKPKDPHKENALLLFGDENRRDAIKPINHGANYGLGANRMIAQGFDPQLVRAFFERFEQNYPVLCQWREGIRDIGRAGQLLDNGFGRKMRCNPSRAYTQAPALMGQGAAADILKEALLRIPSDLHQFLRVPVHDEFVFVAPEGDAEEVGHEVKKAMSFEWEGVPIECDLSKPGPNWGVVSAK
jgi:DNA polymerase-1